MDRHQQTSFWRFDRISGTADSHDAAETKHRDAHARCFAAGWIEAAEYHRHVADWNGASAA